jgi:hypothetical protein
MALLSQELAVFPRCITRAVQLAKEGGVLKLALATNCLGAVVKLTSKELDRSIHGPLVEDIKKMLGEFEASSINHVRRYGNVVAHMLAKEGCVNKVFLDGSSTAICNEPVGT